MGLFRDITGAIFGNYKPMPAQLFTLEQCNEAYRKGYFEGIAAAASAQAERAAQFDPKPKQTRKRNKSTRKRKLKITAEQRAAASERMKAMHRSGKLKRGRIDAQNDRNGVVINPTSIKLGGY